MGAYLKGVEPKGSRRLNSGSTGRSPVWQANEGGKFVDGAVTELIIVSPIEGAIWTYHPSPDQDPDSPEGMLSLGLRGSSV